MISLKCAELLVSLITFLLVYFFSTSIAGAFRALVAKKMGDPTAYQAGFLTLNPLVHLDPLGVVFLCISYFGWSKFIPINPYNIDGSIRAWGIKSGWRIPKLICAYLSDTCMYFFLAFMSLVSLIALFGLHVLEVASRMFICSNCMSHLFIARVFADHSSLSLVVGFILIVIAYLCIVLGVLDCIINGCHLVIALLAERSPEAIVQYSYLTILAPILLILVGAGQFRLLIIACMLHAGQFVARLFGLA